MPPASKTDIPPMYIPWPALRYSAFRHQAVLHTSYAPSIHITCRLYFYHTLVHDLDMYMNASNTKANLNSLKTHVVSLPVMGYSQEPNLSCPESRPWR